MHKTQVRYVQTYKSFEIYQVNQLTFIVHLGTFIYTSLELEWIKSQIDVWLNIKRN